MIVSLFWRTAGGERGASVEAVERGKSEKIGANPVFRHYLRTPSMTWGQSRN